MQPPKSPYYAHKTLKSQKSLRRQQTNKSLISDNTNVNAQSARSRKMPLGNMFSSGVELKETENKLSRNALALNKPNKKSAYALGRGDSLAVNVIDDQTPKRLKALAS